MWNFDFNLSSAVNTVKFLLMVQCLTPITWPDSSVTCMCWQLIGFIEQQQQQFCSTMEYNSIVTSRLYYISWLPSVHINLIHGWINFCEVSSAIIRDTPLEHFWYELNFAKCFNIIPSSKLMVSFYALILFLHLN